MKNKELMEKEIKQIKGMLNSINNIANQDGSITDDEFTILKLIEQELGKYQELLKKALAHPDDEISIETKKQLRQYKKKIFEHARNIAASDGRFYEDEWHILEKLYEILD